MSKQIIRVVLNGKPICTKPFLMNESLSSIREKIKEKVKTDFSYLDSDGNPIEKGDENEFTLENICSQKQINIKSIEEGIKVFLNDVFAFSIDIQETFNLNEARSIIKQKIKDDFTFLDLDKNKVDINDEKDYEIKDILNQDKIILKCESNSDFPPANIVSNENEITPKIIYKKPKPFKKKEIDFSKFEIIKKEENITFYRYSKEQRKEIHKLVYQYNYDKFDYSDDSYAYVILFVGKTGDGKTTAINAFFNIIKGIQLEDEYRFILIEEIQKKKGQAESQTDGVHIYYLKDYNNKPVIVIDSQGYGDTRGKNYDQMLNDAFNYVFTSVIDHINTVCFLAKSNTNRLDILTKYIFSSVTSLFSEDISENFILLSTFASKDTISEGPAFVQSIKTEEDFLNIQKRMDEKWWYAFDSKCILDNDTDKLTKFSFSQMKELYEDKIKKLKPKSIKKCAEVLQTRNELKIQANLLTNIFDDLLIEQANLNEKNKNIKKILEKICKMEENIKNFENESKKLNPKELEEKINELNIELSNKINNLNNETEEILVSTLKKDESHKYTHCDKCQRNCHDPCDCYKIYNLKLVNWCKVFPWGIMCDKVCKECNCPQSEHSVDKYHWVTQKMNEKKDNEKLINEEKKKNEEKKNDLNKKLKIKEEEKNNLNMKLSEFNDIKSKLLDEKSRSLDERNQTEKKVYNIRSQITFIIIKLQSINEKINVIAMNSNHIKTEDEYIDFLKDKMKDIGIKDEEQEESLNNIKRINSTLMEVNKINREDLLNLSDSQLAEKLDIIIPKYKK